MDWILFDEDERDEALLYNEDTIYQVVPRLIDAEHEFKGFFVAPIEVVQGDYEDYWAGRLEDHDRLTADPKDLFVPSFP